MSAPALIYLALLLVGTLAAAHLHGKPKTGKHSFWFHLVSVAIAFGLLYWGGFFASVAA